MSLPPRSSRSAFTIVELLIVVVVIGILAAITIVSFSGVTSQANVASIKSDLDSNSRKLQLYYSQYGSYPTQFDANKCPTAPTADTNYCLKLSGSNTLSNYAASNTNFTLGISNGSTCYQLTDSTSPTNICASSNGYTAEQLLSTATWWIDSAYSTNNQTITNLGTGGSVLNARAGSTTNADSNDPQYLSYDGTPYVYLPGVAGNYLSVPDENALDITGDIDVRVRANLGSPLAANNFWAAKSSVGSGQYSWRLYSDTGGYPVLATSINGTSESFAVADAVPAYSSTLWIRATRASSTGQVLFYTSSDGASWTQLGAAKSTTPGALFANSVNAIVGGWDANNFNTAGAYYRAQVLNGINGSTVLDVDTSVLTSGSATSFTAKTGQTVTINRSTAGRKAVALVSSPVWLYGTDDYAEVADNDLLDFGASDSYSLITIARAWNSSSYTTFLIKGANTLDWTGYILRLQQTSGQTALVSASGSGWGSGAYGPNYSSGLLQSVVATATPTIKIAYANAVAGTLATISGTVANAYPLQIGTTASDMELVSAAVFRRALTQAEITTISNYYAARVK